MHASSYLSHTIILFDERRKGQAASPCPLLGLQMDATHSMKVGDSCMQTCCPAALGNLALKEHVSRQSLMLSKHCFTFDPLTHSSRVCEIVIESFMSLP